MESTKVEIGERVKVLRQERGWKQVDLARRTGLAQSTISHVEDNKFEPEFGTIYRLARVFGVTIDDLLN